MTFKRASGVLLHPTSLFGPHGIGDIGPEAYKWVDFLASTGCSIWQVLPLGPTGYGDSPYQCFSAFAGNPFLVSPDLLIEEDLLHPDDIVESNHFSIDKVDYGAVIPYKLDLLDRAYSRFGMSASKKIRKKFDKFKVTQDRWLADFTLFMAIKEKFGGGPWVDWPEKYRERDPKTLEDFRIKHAVAIDRHAFRQFTFFRQWHNLREYAHKKGIAIVGDIPIFVAHDSSDVWAHPELFYMNADGTPALVAGVPPDYFSETGQLWGNPIYNWDALQNSGFDWWVKRMSHNLSFIFFVSLPISRNDVVVLC